MCALVSIEINQFGGFANAANGSFLDRLPFADERDDATVMVGIHLPIEEVHAVEFHGLNNGINFGFVLSFGKIWDALHQGLHKREAYPGRGRAASLGL